MAGIDYTIPGQFRGIQLESPMNAMAQAMQLRGLQESAQMNALKMQEYQQKQQEAQESTRQRNALAKYLANPNRPTDALELEAGVRNVAPLLADQFVDAQLKRADLGIRTKEHEAKTLEIKTKEEERKRAMSKEQFQTAVSDVLGFEKIDDILASLEQKLNNGDITQAQKDQVIAGLPQNDSEIPAWQIRTVRGMLTPKEIAEDIRATAEAQQKAQDRKAPKPERFDLGGKIITIDMNTLSDTYGKQIREDAKTAAPAAVTESPLAKLVREQEALSKDSPLRKAYDEAISKETGGAPPALVQEYLYAQKNNGFKGTLLDFKKQVAMAGRSVTNNPAPVQTVTVQGPNGPEMRDARSGRLITDDKGQPLKPYDASNKPLSPAQQQKLKKDRLADDAKITSAKDMADDIEKNVDALLGNEKKNLKPHPGLPGITGYNAMLPSLPSGQPRAAQQLLDNVKGKVTNLGKNLVSQDGKIGPMAVQEWKIVADAVERLDPAAPNFAAQLRSIVSQARRLETNLKSRRDETYAADQPPASSNPVYDAADAVLNRTK